MKSRLYIINNKSNYGWRQLIFFHPCIKNYVTHL